MLTPYLNASRQKQIKRMESEKHAFRIRTVKASPFRILIEALKEILTEANLEIDPNGLKIIAMDGTQTVLVHLRLHSEWFEEFYCPQRLILGLNMINFFKLIKTVSNNESLILSMEKEDTTRLSITTLNGENQKTTKYHLNLIELDIHPIEIPPVAFQTTITMPSTDFRRLFVICSPWLRRWRCVQRRMNWSSSVGATSPSRRRFFMLETR